jgi:hypothetical protein
VRTHPVDKLLEQHCYKSVAGLLQLVTCVPKQGGLRRFERGPFDYYLPFFPMKGLRSKRRRSPCIFNVVTSLSIRSFFINAKFLSPVIILTSALRHLSSKQYTVETHRTTGSSHIEHDGEPMKEQNLRIWCNPTTAYYIACVAGGIRGHERMGSLKYRLPKNDTF